MPLKFISPVTPNWGPTARLLDMMSDCLKCTSLMVAPAVIPQREVVCPVAATVVTSSAVKTKMNFFIDLLSFF